MPTTMRSADKEPGRYSVCARIKAGVPMVDGEPCGLWAKGFKPKRLHLIAEVTRREPQERPALWPRKKLISWLMNHEPPVELCPRMPEECWATGTSGPDITKVRPRKTRHHVPTVQKAPAKMGLELALIKAEAEMDRIRAEERAQTKRIESMNFTEIRNKVDMFHMKQLRPGSTAHKAAERQLNVWLSRDLNAARMQQHVINVERECSRTPIGSMAGAAAKKKRLDACHAQHEDFTHLLGAVIMWSNKVRNKVEQPHVDFLNYKAQLDEATTKYDNFAASLWWNQDPNPRPAQRRRL